MLMKMKMKMQPVLAIEQRANPLRSTPQPHLLHHPDRDHDNIEVGEIGGDDDDGDDGDNGDKDEDEDDEDDDEPAKRLIPRTVHPLYIRRSK